MKWFIIIFFLVVMISGCVVLKEVKYGKDLLVEFILKCGDCCDLK